MMTMYPNIYDTALSWYEEWEIPLCPTVGELKVEAFRYAGLVPREALPRALDEAGSTNAHSMSSA